MLKGRKGKKTPNTWGGLLDRSHKLKKSGIKPTQEASQQCPFGTLEGGKMDANGEFVKSTGPDPTGGVRKKENAADKAGYLGKGSEK